MKKNKLNKKKLLKLYQEAQQLWFKLFMYEELDRPCSEAWRLRFITERAFRRVSRRHKMVKAFLG